MDLAKENKQSRSIWLTLIKKFEYRYRKHAARNKEKYGILSKLYAVF
jgi:hypothetical protein